MECLSVAGCCSAPKGIRSMKTTNESDTEENEGIEDSKAAAIPSVFRRMWTSDEVPLGAKHQFR